MRLIALLRERLFGAEPIARRGRRRGRKFQSRPAIRPRFHRLSLERLEDRLAPAILTVNSTGDTVSGLTATLDLREAILLVNSGGTATDSSGNSLAAAKPSQISGAFGSNDTIQFDSSLNGQTITLSGGALVIRKSVTITGLGASSLAVSGNKQSGVFTIDTGTQVAISGLTIEDGAVSANGGGISNAGTLTVSNCTVSGNSASHGGAIYNTGTLTVNNCTLSANSASDGGGIFNDPGGTLTVSDCTVSANSGGGIFNDYGTLTVSNCTVSANSSYGNGGGIFSNGTLMMSNCTVSGNSSYGNGGGIYDYPGTLTVSNLSNCTLVNNSARAYGGGIWHGGGTLQLTNCTVADNSAASFGGGIYENSGFGTLLNNTIVADSISGGDLYHYVGSFSGANDLIGDGSYLSSFTNSLQGNPLLAPLGNYGGPTQTMALYAGSAAIDAGSVALAVDANGNPLTTDQRGVGFPRIINNTVDIGAFEGRVTPATLIVNSNADSIAASSSLTLREAILLIDHNGDAQAALGRSLTAGEAAQISGVVGGEDTIDFSSTLSGQTIALGGTALPALSLPYLILTINGLGASSLAISGNKQSGVFTIDTETQVAISGLTIEDGAALSANGGGISNAGTLTVSNCTVSANSASDGGGGIFNAIGGTLTLSNSTLSGNSAYDGGGIFNDGTLTVSNCILSNNSATVYGGGIDIVYGTLTVLSNCTLAGNSAGSLGGGIYQLNGTLTASNCTLAGNSAGTLGGGIWSNSTLTASNCTLVNNSAYDGGGIYDNGRGTLKLTNCTVAYNSATFGGGIYDNSGIGTLNNTIVADSISGGDLYHYVGSFSGANDLIGDGSQLSSFTNSLQGNPLLAPLGNYGGPTQTMALLPGSPAIDVGSNALAVDANGNPLTTDQRGPGYARIIGASVDIGAYEYGAGAASIAATSGSGQSVPAGTAFGNPLVVTVTDVYGNPVPGVTVTFTAPSSGASAAFSNGNTTISGTTDSNGQVTESFTANNVPGGYTVTASAAGVATLASFNLANTESPAVTINPTSQTVVAGSNVTFTAAASGYPTPTVQWQVSTDGGTTFTAISGATNTPLILSSVTAAMNGYEYEAVFTNRVGSVTTTAAILTVDYAPTVTTTPTSQTVNAGSNVSFTAAASGNPAPTVQWEVSTDGGNTFSTISGATSTTLTLSSVTAAMNGYEYEAVFTNSVGNVTTTTATLTVEYAPSVTTNPANQTVMAGQNATFTAAANGNPTPTVQWQFSFDGGTTWNAISGATSTTLTLANVATAMNGYEYEAVFTNSVGSVTTTAATLTVDYAPTVTTNPTNLTVTAGNNATFTAAASGNPSPSVQWQVSTDGGSIWTAISGATSPTLTLTSVTAAMNGYEYEAVFTNSIGSVTTSAATLTVDYAPTVTTNPVSPTVLVGSNVSFTAAANGNPTPTVQWQVSTDNGTTWSNLSDGGNVSGVTTNTLTLTSVTSAMNGYLYQAVFTNSVGTATTSIATLTVNASSGGPVDVSSDVSVTRSGFSYNFALHEYVQTITITNTSSNALVGPLALQLTNLSTNATLANASGTDANGDPYIDFLSAGQSLAAGQSITVTLYFKDPTFQAITYGTQVWQNLS